ncbi:alanine:cation symporter family protein [Staphylococcus aureus]|nr:alanine:cation symporter family protein [Staphylococcus aureus]
MSLAGRVGTGNIVGVSTAIFIGRNLVQYFGCGLLRF